MIKNDLKKNNTGLFLILAMFFFIRTLLLAPVTSLLMIPDYPYFEFTFGGAAYIAFAIVLSVLSAKLAFVFQEKCGEIAIIVFIIAISDPLFFGTKNNAFKLLIDIIIELFILNIINERKILSTKVIFPIVIFAITFLVPFSILGYVPIMLGIYTLANMKVKKENRYGLVILAGVISAISGFALNKILMNEIEWFNKCVTSFAFSDITETTKRIELVAAFLPFAVFGTLFFRQYKKSLGIFLKKKSKKNKSFEIALDAFFFPVVISIVSLNFFEAESFCAVNVFVPAIILTLLYFKDDACIKTMDEFILFIKKKRMFSFLVFVLVFAFALKGAESYFPAQQLIFYIIY